MVCWTLKGQLVQSRPLQLFRLSTDEPFGKSHVCRKTFSEKHKYSVLFKQSVYYWFLCLRFTRINFPFKTKWYSIWYTWWECQTRFYFLAPLQVREVSPPYSEEKKQTIVTFANHMSIQVDQIRQKVTQIQMVPSFEKKTPICHFFFDSESICERKSVLSIYLSQRWEVCKGLHFTDKRKQTTSFCNLN